MLRFVGNSASERKTRLLVCACCRRFELGHRSRHAIDAAEQLADGLISHEKMQEVMGGVSRWVHRTLAQNARQRAMQISGWGALNLGGREKTFVLDVAMELVARNIYQTMGSEPFQFSDLLRCIFGNPFQPVSLDLRWRTSTVVDLATTIYDERAFDKLPILADALMDAGCDDREMIAHCQHEGSHCLGCWPVDLILDKS